MADNRWTPKAAATKQVDTITVTGYSGAATYKVTIASKVVSVPGDTDANTTAADLTTALAASQEGEFREVAWTNPGAPSAVILGTAVTGGTPITMSASTSGGGSISHSVTTANTSPNDVNDANNWSAGHVPAAAENVYIDNTDISLLWNLNALAAVTLTSLNIAQSFTGEIGLAEQNTGTGSEFTEYRARYFQIGSTTTNIGLSSGNGSGRINLDNVAIATTLNIYNTGSAADTNSGAVQWKGTNASNVLNILGGTVDVAKLGGDTSTIATLRIADSPISGASAPTVYVGAGTTLTTINMENGTLTINSAATTLNKYLGDLTIVGTGTITTLNNLGGNTICNSTGTITTLNEGSGSSFDMSGLVTAITITTMKMYGGSSHSDPSYRGSYSNGIALVNCRIGDVSLDLGPNRTLTPS